MYEPLRRLFRGDEAKVRYALRVFQDVTRDDLEQMIRARYNGDWAELGRLAHKLKSGCMQIGQIATADALSGLEEALSSTAGSDAMEREFVVVCDRIHRVLDHVHGYLDGQEIEPE